MPSLLRSFLAVIIGYMIMILAGIVFTLILVKTLGLQSGPLIPSYLLTNAAYYFAAATLGGYVTARIAHVKPLQHAAILATVMLFMNVLAYQHYAGRQPRWYQLVMIIIPPIFALLGAALFNNARPATELPTR